MGIGSTPGGFQVKPLADIHSRINYVKVVTDLPHGSELFATAVVTNHAGITSVFRSELLTLDHTAPILKDLSVKLLDLKYTPEKDSANVSFHAIWHTEDPESGVAYCYCKVGKLHTVFIISLKPEPR